MLKSIPHILKALVRRCMPCPTHSLQKNMQKNHVRYKGREKCARTHRQKGRKEEREEVSEEERYTHVKITTLTITFTNHYLNQ